MKIKWPSSEIQPCLCEIASLYQLWSTLFFAQRCCN